MFVLWFFQVLLSDLVCRMFLLVVLIFLNTVLSPNFVLCRIFGDCQSSIQYPSWDPLCFYSSFPTESSPSLTISVVLLAEACCGFASGWSKEPSQDKMNQPRKSQGRIGGTVMVTRVSPEPVPVATTSCQRTSPYQSQVCLQFSGCLDKPALMAVHSNIIVCICP